MQQEDVKHKAIRGIVALTSRTVLLQLFNGVALFLLGIFLSPSAIGVFIVVSAVIRIFNLFTDVGLGAALVQKKEELTADDLKVAFTIQEVLVLSIITIGLFVSPLVTSHANLDRDGIFLYQILLIVLFISSLKVIPSILLERRLAFEKQIFPQIIEAIVFDVLVVFLAYKGFGLRSYSWSILTSALVGLPVYYLISPWRISLGFSLEKARKLFSYGLAYQGKSFLAVIKDDLLTFFLSGLVGVSGIGFWGTAQRWAYFPYRFLVDSVTKVTFPAYSRVQQDELALRSGIEKSLFMVSLFLFPILVIASVSVPSLIHIIPRYTKWEPAIISFYFLAAQSAVAALTNILVNVLDATGRVKTTLMLMVMWIIATWVLTILAVARFGFTGISIAAFVVSLSIVVVIFLVKRVVKFDFTANIWRQIIGSLIMGVVAYWILKVLPISIFSVGAAAMAGAIIYAGVIMLLAKKEILEYSRLIIGAYKK